MQRNFNPHYLELKPRSGFGFTIIELMISISIIVILAAMIITNFSAAQRNARDGRRKSDVQTYVSAISNYKIAYGNTFIIDLPNINNNIIVPANTNTLTLSPASGTGVTGADGLSFGKMNLQKNSIGDGGSETVNYYANNSSVTYQYTNTSIAKALMDDGFIANIARDPLNSTSSDNNSPTTTNQVVPDYLLVRCCLPGTQSYDHNGSLFAVWTQLENSPSATNRKNTHNYCGGVNALNNGQSSYYNFGANFDDGFNSNNFAEGNGFPTTVQADRLVPCSSVNG
jgi:prepilin-type N-terminal cleavage/methylation domain-containing protein